MYKTMCDVKNMLLIKHFMMYPVCLDVTYGMLNIVFPAA